MTLKNYIQSRLNIFSDIFPYLIPIVVLGNFLFMVIIGKLNSAIRGLVIAIPAVISCYYVLKCRDINFKNGPIDFEKNVNAFALNINQCYYLFLIFYITSIIALKLNESRPWYYFLLISFCYMTVFIQIFSKNGKTTPILIEIFFLLLNLIYSVTLNYSLYFGTTDILPHIFLAQLTYISGHVVPDYVSDYSYFPLFHILLSESSYLLNLDMQTSYFLIAAQIYAVTVIFIYYIFLRVSKNQQISLLSCALYSSSSNVIYYGVNVITRTMAFIVFTIILYLAYSEKNRVTFKLLSLIFSIFLILIHQVSIPQIMIIFIIIYISEWLTENRKFSTYNYYALLNIMFVSYWIFVAYLFVKKMLIVRLNSLYLDSVMILPGNTQNEWVNTIGLFQYSIFLFFALLAIGLLLKYRKNNYSSTFGFVALFTLIFYVPNPLNTIWQLIALFRIDRMTLLVSPFMAFVMGVGIWAYLRSVGHVSRGMSKNKLLFVFTLLFIFVSISLIYSVSDSDDLWINSKHEYFNNQELEGFNYICNNVPYGSKIYSDYYLSKYFHIENYENLPYYSIYKIENINKVAEYGGYLVIRQQQFLKGGLYFGPPELQGAGSLNELYEPTQENIKKLELQLNEKNKLYSNSAVSLYL